MIVLVDLDDDGIRLSEGSWRLYVRTSSIFLIRNKFLERRGSCFCKCISGESTDWLTFARRDDIVDVGHLLGISLLSMLALEIGEKDDTAAA